LRKKKLPSASGRIVAASGGREWESDASLIVAGRATQSQIWTFLASAHERNDGISRAAAVENAPTASFEGCNIFVCLVAEGTGQRTNGVWTILQASLVAYVGRQISKISCIDRSPIAKINRLIESYMLERASSPPDAFTKGCLSRTVLSSVGTKWTILVTVALKEEPLHFSDLRRKLEGVSDKLLVQTLRVMERDGLVLRNQYGRRLRVEYALSPFARTLLPIAIGLKEWSESSLVDIRINNERFDRTSPRAKPA
jgi:DNA-binding HxlR family transcriptional regulator